jgi:hypothetical protein
MFLKLLSDFFELKFSINRLVWSMASVTQFVIIIWLLFISRVSLIIYFIIYWWLGSDNCVAAFSPQHNDLVRRPSSLSNATNRHEPHNLWWYFDEWYFENKWWASYHYYQWKQPVMFLQTINSRRFTLSSHPSTTFRNDDSMSILFCQKWEQI